jgi:hypothetical protein
MTIFPQKSIFSPTNDKFGFATNDKTLLSVVSIQCAPLPFSIALAPTPTSLLRNSQWRPPPQFALDATNHSAA